MNHKFKQINEVWQIIIINNDIEHAFFIEDGFYVYLNKEHSYLIIEYLISNNIGIIDPEPRSLWWVKLIFCPHILLELI